MDTAARPQAASAASLTAPVPALVRAYAAMAGRAGHDELIDARGRVRSHWRRFTDGFQALGPGGREAAAEATRRNLRESGIAFNVYADPDDRAHAWRLDLLPVILPTGEWARLAAGIVQRARLIEAVLADLYGPRRLLLDGTLPAALVLGAHDHVRPQHGLSSEAGFLTAYACDVARGVDGRWVVLGDQADAPIGNGYVIASRVALSHGLADLFMACHTRRLAGFYMAMQTALQAACPRDDGRIVLLAPGPESPSYFSHAYLARYLGYTLAQAEDLTVRDDTLFLKTLDGLQRVDLLMRKQAGASLDPLSMPGSGLSGVAGLVHATRQGKVRITNALGAGLAQNRALAAWSRALARSVLGEDLLIEDQEALWLGEPDSRRRVLAEPGWLLAPAHARNDPGAPVRTLAPDGMKAAEREALAARLAREGWRFVAQRPLTFATTPAYDEGRLVPVPFAIRCFVARTVAGFAMLPGGLVRMAGSPAGVDLPNGFGSKDLWITAEAAEPQPASILRATMREVHLRRTGRDLLSRTADNLFWLGRYAERAEGIMRLLRSVLVRVLEDGRPDADPRMLAALLDLVASRGPDTSLEEPAGSTAALEELASVLMFEPREHGLRDSLDQLHRTATLVRDQISHDAWRMLATLHVDRRWRPAERRAATTAALELLDDGIRALSAFAGTEAENMTRNFAWRFLEMGRRIERAAQLVLLAQELVPARASGAEDRQVDPGLHLLLELGDSFMTYRSRYMMMPLIAPVLDLLVLDETNPRSVAFQLAELERHLGCLPNDGPHRSAEQRLALKLVTRLRLADVDELVRPGPDGTRTPMTGLLAELAGELPELSDRIVQSHFAHADAQQVTVAMRRAEAT